MRVQLSCALLIGGVAAAGAQTAAVDSIFGFPSGVIACRPVVPPVTDPAAYVFEFLNADSPESQQQRTIAEFDSAGKPLQLVTSLLNPDSTRPIIKMLVVNFPPPTKGEFTVIRVDPHRASTGRAGLAPSDTAGLPITTLNAGQMESARRLAGWFWDHRCNRQQ
jgi:hypothetical protein